MDFEFDDPEAGLHDECVHSDDVLNHVFEFYWDEVEKAVFEGRAKAWLAKSKPFLELLSVIAQRDHSHLTGRLKKWLRQKQSEKEELTEEQLFAIAADVAAYLEDLADSCSGAALTPAVTVDGILGTDEITAARCITLTSKACTLEENLSWAKDLLTLSRAFRDFLSIISDSPDNPYLGLRLREPIQVFNFYLRKDVAPALVFWQSADKQVKFSRCPDEQSSNLCSLVAAWISEYLTSYMSQIGLGVCAECGKFFVSERRDKTFCSKTCQNRTGYRRKKILESNALRQVNIAPDEACDIPAGLWLHHPRYGIGLLESVSSGLEPMLALLERPFEKDGARHHSMLSRRVRLQVRFLQGVRTLGYSDVFDGKEEQLPTFYSVRSEETLAKLL